MNTSKIRSLLRVVLMAAMLYLALPTGANATMLAAAGDMGCKPGNVFSTTTGHACTNATYLQWKTYSTPSTTLASSTDGGCYRGYLFSITTGHICTNATYYFGTLFY